MTDARLPERWLLDRRLNRASDAAHRTFINVLLYAVANRTDGVVDLADLELIPRARSDCLPELQKLELITVDGEQLTLVDWNATQTSREQLEAAEAARESERAADRERKRRKREEARAAQVSPGKSDRTSDRKSDRNPAPETQDRTGQAGQDRQAVTGPPTYAREADYPTVVRPAALPDDPDEWCVTSGHKGCGWQVRRACSDCLASVGAAS